jgi:cytochrome c553
MKRQIKTALFAWAMGAAMSAHSQSQAGVQSKPVDNLAQRLAACTFCHGEQGRAGPDGYYPRLAGKPADYLYHQLLNFQQGRRQYRPMAMLLQHQPDAYLREMAQHFAAQKVPYAPPLRAALGSAQDQRARQLVQHGDLNRQIPACVACHGAALMGTLPATPGLLGLPRDYLNAQLGAWRNGVRRAQSPDCMGDIARRLPPEDVVALSAWLSSQPVPEWAALPPRPTALPMACGSEH